MYTSTAVASHAQYKQMKLFYLPLSNTLRQHIKRPTAHYSHILLHDKHAPQQPPRDAAHGTVVQSLNERVTQKVVKLQSEAVQWLEQCNPHHHTHARGVRHWLRSRVYTVYIRLLDNIHSSEAVYKLVRAAYKTREHIHIYYPAHSTDVEQLKQHLLPYIQHSARSNMVYTVLSILCLPLTLSLTVLPGPNIFAAYNLYRIYSYYVCSIGALNLYNMLTVDYSSTDNDTAVETDSEMKQRGRNISYIASDALQSIVAQWQQHVEQLQSADSGAVLLQRLGSGSYQNGGGRDIESQQLLHSDQRSKANHTSDPTFDCYGLDSEQLRQLADMTKLTVPELQQYLYRWHFK